MEQASVDLVFWLAGGAAAALAADFSYTWWVRNDAIKARDILHKRINALTRDLADYKLAVADKYASVGHLQEVESRLAQELVTMNATLTALLKAISTMQGSLGVKGE